MVAHHADDFDVIPCHIDWVHLPLLERLSVPFLTTMHGRLDLPGLPSVARRFPRAPFVSISDDQRTVLAEANWLGREKDWVAHARPRAHARSKNYAYQNWSARSLAR